jgi:hypothetical protein
MLQYSGVVTVLFVSGCCFVTFFTRKSALDAQNALHNIKTLAGVSATHRLAIILYHSVVTFGGLEIGYSVSSSVIFSGSPYLNSTLS